MRHAADGGARRPAADAEAARTRTVDFALAREIATREGIKAVIDGEMLGVGGTLRRSRCGSCRRRRATRSRRSARRPDDQKEHPCRRSTGLAKEVRAKIGESLRTVQRAPPLEQVTTPSLEALKKYVQGGTRHCVEAGLRARRRRCSRKPSRSTPASRWRIASSPSSTATAAIRAARWSYCRRRTTISDRLSDAERYMLLGTYYQIGPKQDLRNRSPRTSRCIEIQPDYTAGSTTSPTTIACSGDGRRLRSITSASLLPAHRSQCTTATC